jgi:hypothetical protein
MFACGGDGAQSAGDGGTEESKDGSTDNPQQMPPDVKPGGLALRVDQARRAYNGSSWSYLEIALTLANGSGAPAASINPALFQVQTSAGLLIAATLGSVSWVEADNCDPSVSVAAGASFSCSLVFDLKDGNTPTALVYRTAQEIAGVGEDRRSAQAAFSIEPCMMCEQVCTYLDVDRANCGACGTVALLHDESGQGIDAECSHGKVACPEGETLCGEVCADLKTSSLNCGSCGRALSSGSCVEGAPQCSTSIKTAACGTDPCTSLETTDNCGACGAMCKKPVHMTESMSCGHPDGQLTSAPACLVRVLFTEVDDSLVSLTAPCSEACVKSGYLGCPASSQTCANTPQMDGNQVTSLSCDCYFSP